ncbi:MAG TPA: sugar phosphate isomerase/epimerase [Deltaproteobacteria bacterium]|nr:sugar phosphate isomerase/epimerase [Deltaproteobacteria bacterium]
MIKIRKRKSQTRRTDGGQIENPKSKIKNYPSLPKSYKKAFPFKIAATSYIFPDHIIPNVRAVGPFVDEIELILFESKPESLPTDREIRVLETLAKDLDITYNIHLPLDVHLGSHDDTQRKISIQTLNSIFNLTAPLNPTTHTLHLEYGGPADDEENRERWESYLFESFEDLKSGGISGASISVETLFYPLNWLDDIIDEYNLSICMDIGHLILQNVPLLEIFEPYHNHITMLHLHGVENGKDHLSLSKLSEPNWNALIRILMTYKGVAGIEVFSFDHLKASLEVFEYFWKKLMKLRGKE